MNISPYLLKVQQLFNIIILGYFMINLLVYSPCSHNEIISTSLLVPGWFLSLAEGRAVIVVAEVRVAEAGEDGPGAVVRDVSLGAGGEGNQRVRDRAQQNPRGEALT